MRTVAVRVTALARYLQGVRAEVEGSVPLDWAGCTGWRGSLEQESAVRPRHCHQPSRAGRGAGPHHAFFSPSSPVC